MILDKLKSIFKPNPHLNKTIEQLDFALRTQSILKRQGIATVGDLVQLSWNDLRSLRGGNRRTCEEVEKVLGGMGLKLREEE